MRLVTWWRSMRRALLAENVKQARLDYDTAQWLGEKMVAHVEHVNAKRARVRLEEIEEGK